MPAPRSLGLTTATALVVANMVGTGVFTTSGFLLADLKSPWPVLAVWLADEILVNLMRSAGGIAYEEAATDIVVRDIQGVPIPFASPRLLWRMKVVTHHEKDAGHWCFCATGLANMARNRRNSTETAPLPGAGSFTPGRKGL